MTPKYPTPSEAWSARPRRGQYTWGVRVRPLLFQFAVDLRLIPLKCQDLSSQLGLGTTGSVIHVYSIYYRLDRWQPDTNVNLRSNFTEAYRRKRVRPLGPRPIAWQLAVSPG